MSSISTVQRPMPRTCVRRSMIASSDSASSAAWCGTTASRVLAARSLSAATLAKEKPAARRLAVEASTIICGVGKQPPPQLSTRRLRMVAAAVPFSCWCAIACARAWNGWQSSSLVSVHGPAARISAPSTGSAFDRWAWMSWLMGAASLLAGRAIVRGALPLGNRPDRRAASAAGPAGALVYVQALAEVAGRAVGAEVVAQRRAPGADRLGEHRAHALHQPRGLGARQAARLALRAQPRPEQRLAGVDVAHADDQLAVHDELLERHAPPAADAPQVVGVEGARERLGGEPGEQRMARRIAGGVDEAAEAARIVEAQRQSRVEHQVEVVVGQARGVGRHGAQVAGHAEVHQQRPRLELQQQVLGAPPDARDALPGDPGRQGTRHRPAQARLVDGERGDAALARVGREPAPRGFDLGKLGQARTPPARLLDLRLFVGDVLARHRVELLHFELLGVQLLVLGGHVEVAGSGRGQQLDLLAHDGGSFGAALELVALGAQLGDDLVDALLLHGAHAAGRQPQADPALLGLEPEALRVQVRQEATAPLVVGVGDSVTDGGSLAGDFADAGHTNNLRDFSDLAPGGGTSQTTRAGLYTSPATGSQGRAPPASPRENRFRRRLLPRARSIESSVPAPAYRTDALRRLVIQLQ